MNEVNIVLKKEIKNFFARKAMVRWYLQIIFMNCLIILIPQYKIIPITNNKALLCIAFMMFSVLLVPNTLSIDLVGGEKYHHTLESFISTSVDIRNAILAKVIFIEILGLIVLFFVTLFDNILLKCFFHITFFNAVNSVNWIISIYIVVSASILLIAVIGSYVAFNITNLKTGGYIVTLLDLFVVYLLVNNFKSIDDKSIIMTGIFIGGLVLIMLFIVIISLNKSRIMRHIR